MEVGRSHVMCPIYISQLGLVVFIVGERGPHRDNTGFSSLIFHAPGNLTKAVETEFEAKTGTAKTHHHMSCSY